VCTCKIKNKKNQAYSYLGGKDWEDHGSKSAWAKSSQDPISINKNLDV
jgi:hypothetical protein